MLEEDGERLRKAMWNIRICGLMPSFGRQYRSDPLSLCQTAWNMDVERWIAKFPGLISKYRS
jgi:hypothetical protein